MQRYGVRFGVLGALTAGALLAGVACATAGAPAPASPATGATAATSTGTAVAAAKTYPAPLRPDQQVTIKFENYNLASAGIGRDSTLKMIDNFQKKFPNIKVETKATPDAQIFSSVQAQLVAQQTPDVVQLLLREWDLNIENLPMVPLDTIASPDELAAWVKGDEHAFHPRALALTQRNERTYGVAYVFSTPTLFYNGSLFTQAGLNPAMPPKTWEEVAVQAKQIKDRTGNDGLYIACIELDWCTQALLRSNGGRTMSPDRRTLQWSDPLNQQVYSFWQGMVNNGAHAKLSGADASASFQGGRIGMFLQTSAVQGGFLAASRDKWDLRSTGMPSFGTKPAVPTNSGSGLGVFSTDPLKQRASWELVRYLTSEEAFQIITTEIGYLPLRPGMMDDPKYLLNWPNRNLIVPNIQQLEFLEPSFPYYGTNHAQVRDIFLKTQQAILLQNQDVARSWQEAQARGQDLLRAGAR